jgi:hypothetical protein
MMKRTGMIVFVVLWTSFCGALAGAEETARPEAGEPPPAASPGPQRPAADRLQLETTSIRGNQELPRVMVIVPWKNPAMGDLVGKPANSLINEVLIPVDRDVFLRQTKYFEQLYSDPEIAP